MPLLENIQSSTDFTKTVAGFPAVAVEFCADWEKNEQIKAVFQHMMDKYPEVVYMKIDSENMEDVMVKYEIPSVPYFLLFKNGKVVDRILGPNAMDLTDSFAAHFSDFQNGNKTHSHSLRQQNQNGSLLTVDFQSKIQKLLEDNPIMVFMKGTPDNPKSSFDRRLVNALKLDGISFGYFDVQLDDEFQQALKEYSHWPVFPQLWLEGELLGGCSVILEMRETGELNKLIDDYYLKLNNTSKNRLNSLLRNNSIVLFTKARARDNIQTQRVVTALQDDEIDYELCNIGDDYELQERVRKLANWPVFPQLFVRGEFVGGGDTIIEMKRAGDLADTVDQLLSQK